jgi:hypothetical protein
MNESFEDQLRRALKPVDAPAGFAQRVLAALPDRSTPPASLAVMPQRPAGALRRFGMPAALAASLVVAVLAGQYTAGQRLAEEQARGLAARHQVMEALRVTSQKLDVAFEAMKPREQTAEENRS